MASMFGLVFGFPLWASVACGFVCLSSRGPAHGRPKSATSEEEVDALRATVEALSRRLEAVEREVASSREARVRALEAELAAVRPTSLQMSRAASLQTSRAASLHRESLAAVAALKGPLKGTPAFKAPEAKKFEPRQNDAFVDDELEDLLEIGGDPTFLDREAGPTKTTFVWDGVIDETAHFDDDP